MQKLRILSILAMAIGLMASANAQTGQSATISAGTDGSRPTRGTTQAQVEAKFGSPVSKKGAVGDPPISSWEYQNFTVYFEYDRVIHAVLKR
jgi:hypothetical protein